MGWVKIGLSTYTSTAGAGSITLALRDTTNSTAYSAVPGSTVHAVDTVNFTMPSTTNTFFTLTLTSADLPNITAYAMSTGTAYSLIAYNPTVSNGSLTIQRTTGYSLNTTNNFYTVSDGFTALNTFRNSTGPYSNSPGNYPTLNISFGTFNTAPVASTVAISGTTTVGQSLTGSYSYFDSDFDAESGSTYQWYRQDDTSGTNRAAISGASGTTTAGTGGMPSAGTIPAYTLAVADTGKYIVVGVVPMAAAGASSGTEVFSAASSQVISVPGAPSAAVATAGVASASVAFIPPVDNGGAAITGYTVIANPGGLTGTGTASPINVTGLTNGTAYTFTVRASNSVGTGSASAASNSVTPAASLATSYTGTTAGGSVTAAITGGSCAGFQNGSAQYNMPSTVPAGQRFPYGAFSFTVLSCGPGGSVTITQTYPNSIAPNAKYHKLINGNWVDWTSNVTIVGNTVMLTLTDGQPGDTNPTAGEISDPGGITVADESGMAPIPTLSEWMLMVLAGLMAFVAIRRASAVAKAHMSSQV